MKFTQILLTGIVALITTISIAQNANVVLQGQLPYPGQTCANICGYVDSLGNEYALVGAQLGMSVVDVTDPANPVEVIQIPGPDNLWREIKVRGKYAYVTTEGGGGLQIVNLGSLPNTAGITEHSWTGNGLINGQLDEIHALHIDNNFVYLYGSNLFNGGAIVADLTDPWNPNYVGKYEVGAGNEAYVHDGYVRNDTLYAGHIYSGYFSVVDFTDKANPVEIVNQFTPSSFTHNTWLTQDSKVLFTTDEVDDSYLTSYDITDLSNITELDRIQSNPGSGSMVHNVHIINVGGNDYAVTSWYADGFTIVDAARPQNLVQVGNYDTYASSGGGSDGAWGVYPYLPSGNIVVSNIDEGLFVLSPTYVRACYLEGIVTNTCGTQLNNVQITVTAAGINDKTDILGEYKTGTSLPGTYTVTISKSGYISQSITGVVLTPGNVTNLDVVLNPVNVTTTLNGLTTATDTANALSGVSVSISNPNNSYNYTSDVNGAFSSCVNSGTGYFVNVGKWGYETYCASNVIIDSLNNDVSYALTQGYYDDFTFNFGWTVTSTATTGGWQRGIPLGTDFNGSLANPGVDVNSDCANIAYVTGNNGTNGSDDDVDGGSTVLTSPVFDLTGYSSPYLNYSRWFFNAGGQDAPNDSLCIYLNNGVQTVMVEYVLYSAPGSSTWVSKSFRVSDFITPSATMKVIVRTADAPSGHIVEAGFDKFFITDGPSGVEEELMQNRVAIQVYPNPFTNETTLAYQLQNKLTSGASVVITDMTGRTINKMPVTQAKGTVQLNPSMNAGIYFVRIINGSEITEPVKIVKLK